MDGATALEVIRRQSAEPQEVPPSTGSKSGGPPDRRCWCLAAEALGRAGMIEKVRFYFIYCYQLVPRHKPCKFFHVVVSSLTVAVGLCLRVAVDATKAIQLCNAALPMVDRERWSVRADLYSRVAVAATRAMQCMMPLCPWQAVVMALYSRVAVAVTKAIQICATAVSLADGRASEEANRRVRQPTNILPALARACVRVSMKKLRRWNSCN